jgi:hypothetical protein
MNALSPLDGIQYLPCVVNNLSSPAVQDNTPHLTIQLHLDKSTLSQNTTNVSQILSYLQTTYYSQDHSTG